MAFKFILENYETGKNKTIEVKGDGDYIVGRAEGVDIRVGDSTASSKHFQITIKQSKIFVKDLGSRNGILVDGFDVKDARFYIDTVIEFGSYRLRIDKKALSPRELAINRSRETSQTAKSEDITLMVSGKDLAIDRTAFNPLNSKGVEDVRIKYKDIPMDGIKSKKKKKKK